MVVAKARTEEVKNYYNCGNKVKVEVENVGLWQPRQGRERRHGGGAVSSLKSGRWVLGWAPRGGGVMEHCRRCRHRWTWSQRVSCRRVAQTHFTTHLVGLPHLGFPLMLSTHRPFENFVDPQLSSWKGARRGAIRSRHEVLVL